MYNFRSSLRSGKAGEERLHAMFPDWERLDGTAADFKMPNGKLVELKTEQRTTGETANVALELHSSGSKPGAIERAVTDGVSYVIYMFADGQLFIYDATMLRNFLLENSALYRNVKIRNTNYNSTVVLVPRDALKEVEVSLT